MGCCSCFLNYIGIYLILSTLILVLIKVNLHRISNPKKLLILQFGIFLITFLSWPFMLFNPKDYRNLSIPFAFVRKCGNFLGYEVEIRGKENLKTNEGCVIVMNHQSTLDLLLLAYLWPLLGRAKIVVKKALLYYPFLGPVLWLSGFLFIDRKKKNKAINKLNTEITAIQENNYKLLIFAEGTRTLTEIIKPFRKGAFHIAIKSQCPIQPVVFSHYSFLRKTSPTNTIKNFIILSILPQICTDIEFKTEDKTDDLLNKCQNEMQIEYTKITKEIDNKMVYELL